MVRIPPQPLQFLQSDIIRTLHISEVILYSKHMADNLMKQAEVE
jgi:hypothetical protein